MKASETGARGEAAVCRYLEQQGYTILARNYRIPGGELDAVAYRGAELCFVEVKTRRPGSLADGMASVSLRKRRLLIRAAQEFCMREEMNPDNWFIRFDVAAVEMQGGCVFSIDYLGNAFTADS